MDYRDAGVDVEAGRGFVQRIRSLVDSTRRPEVLGSLGGFSGLCELPAGYREPVLVSGTDGVGTKLKIAQMTQRHSTVGIDLVAMCVNDILTSGAEPLFFLDYLATGKLEPAALAEVVEGIAAGCRQAGCALLGGETAEMPGFYGPGEYDLAGFCVGIVEKSQILDGSQIEVGDRVIGLASSGVHSNGFSLVRKVVAEGQHPSGGTGYRWDEVVPTLGDLSLAEVLLTPTRIYVEPVLKARREGLAIHGMAHITGGGLPENLPRCLGPGQSIQLEVGSWPVPPVFSWLAQAGDVPENALYNTFNMGIGFALVVPANHVDSTLAWLAQHQVAAYSIGEVVAGSGQVTGLPD
ncbi:phosphoribosylformylglycinamidine cyclo-ligase [Nodosilinea sp. LEGE 06152]|uniref:phosphoribosylformylglycinamidine cyclo-ligase n=1 Tax=Nodosilinea sp. LEGE 06152 TaxID=2777966 RepID=UPI001880F0E2|nr:phosphoribosylformylglycinamidine cyclo-ligase [Nodosilinea sp. LEGE 06152]MBE9155358.1 phosphoribosylformylglycinamidine cyclo-ligase [Nodosilinea sp. LEGE 06152]